MPEPVIYMRGFQSELNSFIVRKKMLVDLKVVAALDDSQVDAVRVQLQEAEGFLSPARMLSVIRGVIPDDKMARSVRTAVRNLASDDIQKLLESLSAPSEEGESLDNATLERLRQRLPRLIQPYPALARAKKASRLVGMTGEALESVELLCDLRPVFDESRKEVEGMIPYTRLRIIVTGVDGLPKSYEAELSHQQVHDLAEKAQKALVKLDVLRQDVDKWLPGGVPDLPSTRLSSKEVEDA
jgi:hypothetical protein